MKLPFETPVEVQTCLSTREVYTRLRDAVPSVFAVFASRIEHPVGGIVKKDICWLKARTFYSNGIQRRLRLRFEGTPAGTKLVGEFRLQMGTMIFGTFWFGFLTIANLILIAQSIRMAVRGGALVWQDAFVRGKYLAALVPSAMLISGYLLLRFGVWLSKHTEADVVEFVENVLAAPPSAHQRKAGTPSNGEVVLNGEVLIRPRHETPNP